MGTDVWNGVAADAIVEMQRVGPVLRVTAMDPMTLTEVSVVGPATGAQAQLRAVVLRKLQQRVERAREGAARDAARSSGRSGRRLLTV